MSSKACPSCGAAIQADQPEGLCAGCLLKRALSASATAIVAPLRCVSCQSVLDEHARFCATCGAAVPEAAANQGDPLRGALEAKLAGQYRLGRLLGQGGMGAVYLARDLTLERQVAIKIIRTDGDAREVHERFRREARTAARLSHPNIVPLHAFGEVAGMPYFVMGYVRGESLATRLKRDGLLPENEARRILFEIADALDHAHRQGIVHRDVKPDNVLLDDESGRALLTDFGVAKALGQGETLTGVGSVVGTPHYMSPEQASGRGDIDGRSDLYSLGVMAYSMLAGRLPFEGSTPAQVLSQHLTQAPAALNSPTGTLSDSLVQAVMRCLEKDPARRWADARSFKLAIGSGDDAQLPDSLQSVQSRGVPALIILAMFTLFWVSVPQTTRGVSAGWAAATLGGWFLVFYAFAVARLRREGFSLKHSQAVIWHEPTWWLWWYPRPLRRRGNAWDRLPRVVRYLRWSIFAFVLYVATANFYVGLFAADEPPTPHPEVLIFIPIVISGLVFNIAARRELKRKGLGPADTQSVMMSVPPSRASFWMRPHIAAVLAPADDRATVALRSGTPHDLLQLILRQADELSGPFRPLGAQSTAAARQLLESIEHADREISALARTHEAGEEARLADKIAALAPVPGRADETAPMRRLLEQQLELVRDLSARIVAAKETRHRHIELLKALALHLATLRARCTEPSTELHSLSDRVRALCDDIAQQALTPVRTGASRALHKTEVIGEENR